MLLKIIEAIERFTATDYTLIVCDDGSSPENLLVLSQHNIPLISGDNRGVAWNKNRGIYYLMECMDCDVVILIDDDVMPKEVGWEAGWIEAAIKFGHVNYAFDDMVAENPPHSCSSDVPGLTTKLSGQCIAFSRFSWMYVGYFDPRFGRFGHEHTEYTNRFLKMGFGGIILNDNGNKKNFYFVYRGKIKILDSTSNGSTDEIAKNQVIYDSINRESDDNSLFRLPWTDKEQQKSFLNEIFNKLSGSSFNRYRNVGPIYNEFKPEDYVAINPDVGRSTLSPWEHFFEFGLKEKRSF